MTVVLPASWTDCAIEGVDVAAADDTAAAMPAHLDDADFSVVSEADPLLMDSERPWAGPKYAGCGESALVGGVRIPAAVLTSAGNVSRDAGEYTEQDCAWETTGALNI